MERQEVKYEITVPYIGGGLSENAYKLPTRGTKPSVKKWMRELASEVADRHIPVSPRYVVNVRGHFRDERRPDISNLFKVILDAVATGIGVNDKYFLAKDGGYETGYIKPSLIITIEVIK